MSEKRRRRKGTGNDSEGSDLSETEPNTKSPLGEHGDSEYESADENITSPKQQRNPDNNDVHSKPSGDDDDEDKADKDVNVDADIEEIVIDVEDETLDDYGGDDDDEEEDEDDDDYENDGGGGGGGGEEPFPGAMERQEGDGEETPTPVDDDEDKKNPQYIPKKGMFYEHDDRLGTDEEEEEEDKDKDKDKKKIWKADQAEKWGHDKFMELDQEPKSKDELVASYGYDIRNEDNAPRARRRRRYGRGPNKYTRNWEDEDAYSKPSGVKGGTGGRPVAAGAPVANSNNKVLDNKDRLQQEDFPELPSKSSSGSAIDSSPTAMDVGEEATSPTTTMSTSKPVTTPPANGGHTGPSVPIRERNRSDMTKRDHHRRSEEREEPFKHDRGGRGRPGGGGGGNGGRNNGPNGFRGNNNRGGPRGNSRGRGGGGGGSFDQQRRGGGGNDKGFGRGGYEDRRRHDRYLDRFNDDDRNIEEEQQQHFRAGRGNRGRGSGRGINGGGGGGNGGRLGNDNRDFHDRKRYSHDQQLNTMVRPEELGEALGNIDINKDSEINGNIPKGGGGKRYSNQRRAGGGSGSEHPSISPEQRNLQEMYEEGINPALCSGPPRGPPFQTPINQRLSHNTMSHTSGGGNGGGGGGPATRPIPTNYIQTTQMLNYNPQFSVPVTGVPPTVAPLPIGVTVAGAPVVSLPAAAMAGNVAPQLLNPGYANGTTEAVLLAAAAAAAANQPPGGPGAPGPDGFAAVRGGVTYFNTTAQNILQQRSTVSKRPKAAIPIVDPGVVESKDLIEANNGGLIVRGDDNSTELAAQL